MLGYALILLQATPGQGVACFFFFQILFDLAEHIYRGKKVKGIHNDLKILHTQPIHP